MLMCLTSEPVQRSLYITVSVTKCSWIFRLDRIVNEVTSAISKIIKSVIDCFLGNSLIAKLQSKARITAENLTTVYNTPTVDLHVRRHFYSNLFQKEL